MWTRTLATTVEFRNRMDRRTNRPEQFRSLAVVGFRAIFAQARTTEDGTNVPEQFRSIGLPNDESTPGGNQRNNFYYCYIVVYEVVARA